MKSLVDCETKREEKLKINTSSSQQQKQIHFRGPHRTTTTLFHPRLVLSPKKDKKRYSNLSSHKTETLKLPTTKTPKTFFLLSNLTDAAITNGFSVGVWRVTSRRTLVIVVLFFFPSAEILG
jgi:hypothetical protein